MRITSLLAVVWVGCGGGVTPVDSGAPIDAGRDARVALCGSDSFCDDRLFCTGTERCLPGEVGAGPDGCVAGSSPCGAGTACNEDGDRCDVDDCAIPDGDNDGDPRPGCGGSDCDDTDRARSGRTPEVCDALGVDEDCNPATIYNRDTRDGDVDNDLHAAVRCFNPTPSGGETRGDDCDDMDGAIYAGAPERCNGLDDDCDTTRDEDFDCVQSTPAIGMNACGREGMRRCSDACAWLDPSFYVAESAATCDYCDDSGMGLGQELPFTVTDASTFFSTVTFGTAFFQWCVLGGGECTLLTDVATNSAGAAYQEIVVGHGMLTIRQDVAVTSASTAPTEGWAIAVLDATDPSPTFLGSPAQSGVVAGRRGLAVRHRFRGSDLVELLDLAPAAPRVIAASSQVAPIGGAAGMTQFAWLQLRITPDQPATPADETAVVIEFPRTGCSPVPFCLESVSCSNLTTARCGFTITPGSRLWLGVTAGSTNVAAQVRLNGSTTSSEGSCP